MNFQENNQDDSLFQVLKEDFEAYKNILSFSVEDQANKPFEQIDNDSSFASNHGVVSKDKILAEEEYISQIQKRLSFLRSKMDKQDIGALQNTSILLDTIEYKILILKLPSKNFEAPFYKTDN